MSLAEVVPMARSLPREERRKLVELLTLDLECEEDNKLLASLANTRHEIWSPFESFDAAEKLEELLRSERAK